MRTITVPFEGFYESSYSGEVNHLEEREAESLEERDREEQPEELRLTASEFGEIFYWVTDYRACYGKIAEAYVDAFSWYFKDALGIDLQLKFESMSSPREYNFTTDRLFAYIPDDVVEDLFRRSEADGHKSLQAVLKERHTSYDGFISFYSNDLTEWLEKPLDEWDHNELESLMQAALLIAGADKDWREAVLYAVIEGEGCWEEFQAAVDWKKFDEKVAEAREKKRQAFIEQHPDLPAPVVSPRCENTPDMFKRC